MGVKVTVRSVKLFAGVLLLFLLCYSSAASWKPAAQDEPTAHESRPWRPTGEVANLNYFGAAVCAECHAAIFQSQSAAPMAGALEPANESAILKAHPRLVFHSGRFSYLITRQGKQISYTVTAGAQSISASVLWSFGRGLSARTYLLRHDNEYYESRLSYYTAIEGLDYTLGYPREPAGSIAEAMGRKLEPDEFRKCIACHSTGAVVGNQVYLDRLEAGVRCEACHGPGGRHVSAMKAGRQERLIFNPRRLSPDALSQELCGSCHRSVDDVFQLPNRGDIHNVRFQPYRIFGSKCYGDDPRISCTACHDPHATLRHEVAFYDQKCLACHLGQGAVAKRGNEVASTSGLEPNAPPCPVRPQDCVSCHMPKFGLPGSHFEFTDHRIRISKPGMPFPI